MAELLKALYRGPRCTATARVGAVDDGDQSGTLLCNLQPEHPGPLHYDAADRIWWSAGGDDS